MGNLVIRRVTLGCALFVLASCGGATAEGGGATNSEPPPPAPTFTSTHVLTGPEGARVEIAEFGTEDAYLKITGVRSPVAGIVFPVTMRQNGRSRLEYITTRDGSDYYPIHKETQRDGSTRWTLYAPGLSSGVVLEWSEEESPTLDGDALHATYVEQSRDGTLEAIQTFDRDAAQQRNDEAIARDLAHTEEECGSVPEWSFAWDTISDEVLKEKSIAGYCGSVLQAFRNLCRWDPAKAFVASVDRIECSWIDEEQNLELSDGALSWQVSETMTNGHEKAKDALLELETESGDSLAQALVYAQSRVCRSPDDEHVVIVHPHRQGGPMGISYGTPEKVYHSPQPQMLSQGWFFDPRQENPGNNESFRGFDLRFYSHVAVDDEEDSCQLTCGERETEWTLLSPEDAREVMANAESEPAPFDREPYALARDRRGIYYYVDRGNTPDTRRDFHVYRGRRGRMEQLQMQDIVSDSEGEIFATASGSLRLLVDNDEGAHWIQNERPKDLRRVPIAENYKLIMEELGVYLGERFELPCDDY